MFNKSAIRIPQSAMTCAVVAFTASAVIVASQERMPRTPDGRPDLQGIYDLATLTPLERRAGTPLVLTSEETARLEKDVAQRSDALAAPINADRAAPPKGGDGSPGPYGNVGGYAVRG